jgi:hypothetical protein
MSSEIDDRLQQYLNQIEKGVPKDRVLASLRSDDQELAALIKLADAMRTISHPMPAPGYSRAAKQQIMAAVPRQRTWQKASKPKLGWLALPNLSGAVALLVIMLVTFGTLGVWLIGPAKAHVANVTDVQGVVETARSANADEWVVLAGGETMRSGHSIRTSPGSSATLVFADGSRAVLGAETSLVLQEVDGNWSGDVQVEIQQTVGQTSHSVIALRGKASYYKVITPTGSATVHGTSFRVDVAKNGTARFIVESGEVAVDNAATQVMVSTGQATVVEAGQPPETPGNYFRIVDLVTAIDPQLWQIQNRILSVTNRTNMEIVPIVGQALQIEGRILANGQWVADKIQPPESKLYSSFRGVVEKISTEHWMVSGISVVVNDVTRIPKELAAGAMVEVVYLPLTDESWLALEIDELDETANLGELNTEETLTAVETTVEPVLPTEEPTQTCALGDQQLLAEGMAATFNVTYEELASWYCKGFNLNEIELAYALSAQTGTPVYVVFSFRTANLEWSEISALLQQSQPPAPTTEPGVCMNSIYQPRAEQIAAKYGVTYNEVIGWYCDGYNWGQIDLAYSLGDEYAQGPESIFKKLENGENFGQIKKELNENSGKPEDKVPNPNKPVKEESEEETDPANDDKDNPSTGGEPPGLENKP